MVALALAISSIVAGIRIPAIVDTGPQYIDAHMRLMMPRLLNIAQPQKPHEKQARPRQSQTIGLRQQHSMSNPTQVTLHKRINLSSFENDNSGDDQE
jgi:hypothetical protein